MAATAVAAEAIMAAEDSILPEVTAVQASEGAVHRDFITVRHITIIIIIPTPDLEGRYITEEPAEESRQAREIPAV